MNIGYSNNIKNKGVLTCTPELFNSVLDSPHVANTCTEIHDALEAVKRGEMSREDFETFKATKKKALPYFTFHAIFKNGERKNKEAIPSGLAILDIDHIEGDVEVFYNEKIRGKEEKMGIVFAHRTPSYEGLRLVFRIPEDMTIAKAQAWIAGRLKVEKYDTATKDYARASFAVPRDYFFFIEERFLKEERGERGEERELQQAEADAQPSEPTTLATPALQASEHITPPPILALQASSGRESGELGGEAVSPLLGEGAGERPEEQPALYGNIPYPILVKKIVEQLGGEPAHGSRNTFIFSLACYLRYVCDDNAEWIKRIIPTFGEDRARAMATVDSACNRNQSGMMPDIVRRAIATAKKEMRKGHDMVSAELSKGEDEGTSEPETPPELPKSLPRLIRLLTSKTPQVYKAAVAQAVFPSLGAHLYKTRFRYTDNVEHEATLMNVLMAPTGAGKSCVNEPIKHIMADIKRRDDENLQREKAWKDACKLKSHSKDKPQRPEGLVIQEVDADTTNAAFVMRLAEADGHFLYMRLNEINLFDALKGNGKTGQQFRLMCLAFDPGAEYGQTRIGVESVTERVGVRFNWNASTTIIGGQRYFSKVLIDGPLSRINFCTIPQRECGAEQPVFGTYDSTFDEELRPYIENLTRARGLIECPHAFALAKKMLKENAELARVSQDRVYENLSFRSLVIAYLKACVLFVANGYEWEKSIEAFVRWSFKYDMWCKIQFFGAAIDEAENVELKGSRPGPSNLLLQLPNEFTMDDVIALRKERTMATDNKSCSKMVHIWMRRGYIEEDTVHRHSYKKLKYITN